MSKFDPTDLLRLSRGLAKGAEITEAAAKHFVAEFSDDLARIADDPDATVDDFFARIRNDDVLDAASKAALTSPEFRSGFSEIIRVQRFQDEFQTLGTAATPDDVVRLTEKYGLSETERTVQTTTRLAERNVSEAADAGASSVKASTDTADTTSDAAKPEVKGYFSSSATRGERLAIGSIIVAAPITFMVIERETGGAISHTLFSKAADAITDAYKEIPEDERKAWLVEKIDNAALISDLASFNFLKTGGLNVAVDLAMRNGDIEDGKNAAIKYVLVTSPLHIGMKTGLRMQVLDEAEKEMPMEARNKLIAEGLIEDVIKAAHSNALNEKQITAEDIVKALENKNGKIVQEIPLRVQNGLVQLYPELEDVFPDHASFKRETPLESATQLTEEHTASAQGTIDSASDTVRSATQDISDLTAPIKTVAKVGFFGGIMKKIESLFDDIISTIKGWVSAINIFSDSADVKESSARPTAQSESSQPSKTKSTVTRSLDQVAQADMPSTAFNQNGVKIRSEEPEIPKSESDARREFERSGGPTQADAERVIGPKKPLDENASMTRREFERSGGPTQADAQRVAGRKERKVEQRQPVEEPTIELN